MNRRRQVSSNVYYSMQNDTRINLMYVKSVLKSDHAQKKTKRKRALSLMVDLLASNLVISNMTRQTKVLTRLTRSLVHPIVQQAHHVLSSAQLLFSEISLISIRHLWSERWSTEVLLLGLENHRHSFSSSMKKQVNVQIDRVRGCIVSLVEYFSSRTDPQSGTAPNRADHRHEQHSLQRGRTADERGEWEWERATDERPRRSREAWNHRQWCRSWRRSPVEVCWSIFDEWVNEKMWERARSPYLHSKIPSFNASSYDPPGNFSPVTASIHSWACWSKSLLRFPAI